MRDAAGKEPTGTEQPYEQLRESFLTALIQGEKEGAHSVLSKAISQGVEPKKMYAEVVLSAHRDLQQQFYEGRLGSQEFEARRNITWKELSYLKSMGSPETMDAQSAVVASIDGGQSVPEAAAIAQMLKAKSWAVQTIDANSRPEALIEAMQSGRAAMVFMPVTSSEALDQLSTLIPRLRGIERPICIVLSDISGLLSKEIRDQVDIVVFSNEEAVVMAEALIARRVERSLEEYLSRIGKTVRARRRVLGLSQTILSQRCGLDRAYLSAIENGRQNITVSALLRVGSALGLSLEQLVAGIEELTGLDEAANGASAIELAPT